MPWLPKTLLGPKASRALIFNLMYTFQCRRNIFKKWWKSPLKSIQISQLGQKQTKPAANSNMLRLRLDSDDLNQYFSNLINS